MKLIKKLKQIIVSLVNSVNFVYPEPIAYKPSSALERYNLDDIDTEIRRYEPFYSYEINVSPTSDNVSSKKDAVDLALDYIDKVLGNTIEATSYEITYTNNPTHNKTYEPSRCANIETGSKPLPTRLLGLDGKYIFVEWDGNIEKFKGVNNGKIYTYIPSNFTQKFLN